MKAYCRSCDQDHQVPFGTRRVSSFCCPVCGKPLTLPPKDRSELRNTSGRRSSKSYADLVAGMECAWPGRGGLTCGGRIDPHHLIREQTLRRLFPHGALDRPGSPRRTATPKLLPERMSGLIVVSLTQILRDQRNIIPVCREHHNGFHAPNGFTVQFSELPLQAIEFAELYGIRHELEREYPVELFGGRRAS